MIINRLLVSFTKESINSCTLRAAQMLLQLPACVEAFKVLSNPKKVSWQRNAIADRSSIDQSKLARGFSKSRCKIGTPTTRSILHSRVPIIFWRQAISFLRWPIPWERRVGSDWRHCFQWCCSFHPEAHTLPVANKRKRMIEWVKTHTHTHKSEVQQLGSPYHTWWCCGCFLLHLFDTTTHMSSVKVFVMQWIQLQSCVEATLWFILGDLWQFMFWFAPPRARIEDGAIIERRRRFNHAVHTMSCRKSRCRCWWNHTSDGRVMMRWLLGRNNIKGFIQIIWNRVMDFIEDDAMMCCSTNVVPVQPLTQPTSSWHQVCPSCMPFDLQAL